MYRLWPLGSHVILNLPHFQPIRSSNFAAQQISQSENVAEAEKCATYSKIQLTLGKTMLSFSHQKQKAKSLTEFFFTLLSSTNQYAHIKVKFNQGRY